MQRKNIYILIAIASALLITIFSIFKNQSTDNTDIKVLEIETVIKDHRFDPAIIKIPSGTKIRFIIHNHDDTVEEFESHDLHREKIVRSKESITIILAPLSPGKYDFFGDFNQETAQGSLIVE
ncbi:MAG: cupredoxin domain-containing protein [Rickettsia endosymbiont of Bryobia graminum]|nr:cupredoxin domain-containing protein [Rickettsia endosymbiont of Bryobia graminum]